MIACRCIATIHLREGALPQVIHAGSHHTVQSHTIEQPLFSDTDKKMTKLNKIIHYTKLKETVIFFYTLVM